MFKEQVQVVVDELVSVVLRSAGNATDQTNAIEAIGRELLNRKWKPTSLGLARHLLERVVTRAPRSVSSELLHNIQTRAERESTASQGLQHSVVKAFAEIVTQQLTRNAQGRTVVGLLEEAAHNAAARTTDTEFRRLFWHLLKQAGLNPSENLARLLKNRTRRQLTIAEQVAFPYGALDPAKSPAATPEAQVLLEQAAPIQKGAEEDIKLDVLKCPPFSSCESLFEDWNAWGIVEHEGRRFFALGYRSTRRKPVLDWTPQTNVVGTKQDPLFICGTAMLRWDAYGKEKLVGTKPTQLFNGFLFDSLIGVEGWKVDNHSHTSEDSPERLDRKYVKFFEIEIGLAVRFWLSEQRGSNLRERFLLIEEGRRVRTFTNQASFLAARKALHAKLQAGGYFKPEPPPQREWHVN